MREIRKMSRLPAGRKPAAALIVMWMILASVLVDPAEAAPEWELGGGAIRSFGTETLAVAFVRHHFDFVWHGIRPWSELAFIEQGAFWLGAGLRYDLELGAGWAVSAASGPGWFGASDAIDLGHEVEFHSSIELVRRIGASSVIVAGIGHISNAGLGKENPGATTYRLSCRRRF